MSGGPCWLLLHGVGGNRGMWDGVVGARALAGVALRALDLPGYGDGPALPSPYDFDALAAWLAGEVDRAGAPAVLVGQSFGGMIALDFAARHPERVAGLVLMNSTAAFGRPDGDWQQRFVADRLAPLDAGRTMAEVAAVVAPPMIGPGARPGAREAAEAMMARVPPDTYRAAVRCLAGFDRRDALARLPMPVLCVAGTDDRTAPAETMRRMAERIPGARFDAVDGGGHLLPIEQPDVVAGLLAAFAARVPNIAVAAAAASPESRRTVPESIR